MGIKVQPKISAEASSKVERFMQELDSRRTKVPKKPSTPRKVGRPTSGKVRVTLLLSPDVVAKFKATGPGWQSRINEVLKAAKV